MAKLNLPLSMMKDEINKIFVDETIIKIIFSRSKNKEIIKTIGKEYIQKGKKFIQFEQKNKDGKVYHTNVLITEASTIILKLLLNYNQLNIITNQYSREIKKNGIDKFLILIKKIKGGTDVKIEGHNRKKEGVFREGRFSPFLYYLGIMDKNGVVYKKSYNKYKQINNFLYYFAEAIDILKKHNYISIVDLCCGKGYLTFSVYAYLLEQYGIHAEMYAVDRKEEVIDQCIQIAEQLGYRGLHFIKQDISEFQMIKPVDIVISLHACDTATDIVLSKAIKWNAKIILSSPCCHHELAEQISTGAFPFILQYPILRQRFSEILTDAIRADILKKYGYKVDIIEFIEMEHTHKNLLIRAYKDQELNKKDSFDLDKLCKQYAIAPSLMNMLNVRKT